MDSNSNMVIIKNPTIMSTPKKSSYEPKIIESDTSIDSATTEEINEFLKTFFTLYPSASEKEIAYYANDNLLKPIGKKYVFVELVNPIYTKADEMVKVSVYVKYLDDNTKTTQISQFNLLLQKSDNWKIVSK